MDDYNDDGEGVAEAALYAELDGKTVQEILQEGQKALFVDLVVKVRSGKASHQEKAILRNILRDNGFMLGIPSETPEEAKKREAPADLPDFDTPEYD